MIPHTLKVVIQAVVVCHEFTHGGTACFDFGNEGKQGVFLGFEQEVLDIIRA